MHNCNIWIFHTLKYFGKGCKVFKMIILIFINLYKFIWLDLEHYFKSYKRKQKIEKEKKIDDVSDDVIVFFNVLDVIYARDNSPCAISSRLDSWHFIAPNYAPYAPTKSPRAPLYYPSASPPNHAPRPTNFFAGAPPPRRRVSPFPAIMVSPWRQSSPLTLSHPADTLFGLLPQRIIAFVLDWIWLL